MRRRLLQIGLWMMMVPVLLTSCLKEEQPVEPPDLPGNVETVQIPMGWKYDKQYFFDLKSGQIVSSNLKTAWDLAFECGQEGYHIILNTSKFMFARNTGIKDFNAVTEIGVNGWRWDVASGNLDSTAIGDWGVYADGNVDSYGDVYVIDRGKDPSNHHLGFKKVIFEKMQNNIYHLRYANLDGSEEHTLQVKKDDALNFVYFSFDNQGQRVDIAPPKDSWDLVFTQYTYIFNESPQNIPQPIDTLIPYLVTGVLQNRNDVEVAEDFTTRFEDIGLVDAVNAPFEQSSISVIGYDWKYFNFDEVTYTVLPEKNYIIKDNEGFLYKLHFIDYYSDAGERGYPKFQYQRL